MLEEIVKAFRQIVKAFKQTVKAFGQKVRDEKNRYLSVSFVKDNKLSLVYSCTFYQRRKSPIMGARLATRRENFVVNA